MVPLKRFFIFTLTLRETFLLLKFITQETEERQ